MCRIQLTIVLVAVVGLINAADTVPKTGPAVLGEFTKIGLSNCVGTQLAAVPDTDQFLFMERPQSNHPDGKSFNAGLMDSVTGAFTNIKTPFSMENCGHSYLENGTVAILAGHKPQSSYVEGRRALQVLNLQSRTLDSVGSLQFGHWLATATRLPNGMITIMSDSPSPVGPARKDGIKNPFYELWDPTNPATTKAFQLDNNFLSNTKYFYYPFNFVLPTGDMFVWSNKYGQIINPLTGKKVLVLPNWKGIPQAKGMCTQYPFSGTAAMLPLRATNNFTEVEIMVFGGQWSYGWVNTTAVDLSMRLKIKILPNGTYDVGQWQAETMPSPRVSGTSVLLPNGMVLLINGAKRGLLGDAVAGGDAMLNEPNLTPVLYDPLASEGSRYTELARGSIPRLLHSAAGLTLNGTAILAGGDRSSRYWMPADEAYSPSSTGFAEYRVELFAPPQVFDTQNRPAIMACPFSIGFSDVTSIAYLIPNTTARVTSVVLIAPSSDTHTFNMHQRIVELEILDSDNDNNHVGVDGDRSVTVRGPPNANVAPPGPYMIFLLSGRTWGPAQWINVVRS
ncbi:hypothetical protein CHLRE_16g657250v5 [Chlamydomonas reinhardtii]|uniref:Glyoxal or galactose oxidase n=1 Tax=Chlamydomonas reinhardtii TaxID=3055 RepID=A0A2K3CTA9_CHLRE|nr:uncharacterized protein CHLRE_16g657250v5 [Chlamydomonas reinhardtii]PNW71509.1 hypothetical protein CHLRE_16g657250v5 [Chlamydomonas reinhardtii]